MEDQNIVSAVPVIGEDTLHTRISDLEKKVDDCCSSQGQYPVPSPEPEPESLLDGSWVMIENVFLNPETLREYKGDKSGNITAVFTDPMDIRKKEYFNLDKYIQYLHIFLEKLLSKHDEQIDHYYFSEREWRPGAIKKNRGISKGKKNRGTSKGKINKGLKNNRYPHEVMLHHSNIWRAQEWKQELSNYHPTDFPEDGTWLSVVSPQRPSRKGYRVYKLTPPENKPYDLYIKGSEITRDMIELLERKGYRVITGISDISSYTPLSGGSGRRSARRSTTRRATRRSARRSARRATRRSTRRSARRSTRRSVRISTRRSIRRSTRRSVRRAARRSVRRSAKRSAKRSTIKRYPKVKQGGKLPAIFVINLRRDKDKWEKYKKDSRYIRYSACNGVEMSRENPYFDRLQIMWNAGDRKRKCTAGILNSHMSVIEMIVKKKINKALVIEDDAIVDFTRLRGINLDQLPQDSIIYFGGTLHPPTSFKDKSWSYKKTIQPFKQGVNVIDSKKYRILGGHGYYFPTWEVAKQLYDIVSAKPKMRALDTEMTYLQRKGIIKYFYYPALSYLNMDDAKKGVHAIHMHRDMKHYG
jgi:GR25 family glycosyltransferase involved in LPS biosynthesis